jgi:hypothetical protein
MKLVRHIVAALALSAAAFAQVSKPAPSPISDDSFVQTTLYPAVALLYEQDGNGGMHVLCTATAIEKHDLDYTFVSAAHCAVMDDTEKHKAKANSTEFFITSDESDTKSFLQADLMAAGYRTDGDDFSLFKVHSTKAFPIVPIGVDSTNLAGEQVVDVASPLGLGKQTFYGRISSPRVDRAIKEEDINWTHAMLLQLPGTDGGSSGSAIVCLSQQAICGFLVGTENKSEIFAIPASRFKRFWDEVKAGKYKKFEKPDADEKDVEKDK